MSKSWWLESFSSGIINELYLESMPASLLTVFPLVDGWGGGNKIGGWTKSTEWNALVQHWSIPMHIWCRETTFCILDDFRGVFQSKTMPLFLGQNSQAPSPKLATKSLSGNLNQCSRREKAQINVPLRCRATKRYYQILKKSSNPKMLQN